MRIPVKKIYRAFPELDGFSDEACERFVKRALHGGRVLQLGFSIAAGVGIGLLLWPLLIVVCQTLMSSAGEGIVSRGVQVVGLTGSVWMPAVGGLAARDVVMRRWLSRWIVESRCPGCEYPLEGLPIEAGRVKCPECGEETGREEKGRSGGV